MSEHEEELEITLEEQIKILQEQGFPPEKVVEEILKEDINADINILANTLKLDKMVIGRIKGRLSRIKKRQAAKVAPRTEEEEGSLYKGELDTTRILKDILTKHPDIPSKVVDEVCSWAEYGPIHPTQLVSLLQSFRGITATTAYIIAQKYALALQKAQQEGKVAPIVVGGSVPQGGPQPFGFFPTGFPGPAPMSGGMPPAPSGVPQYGVQQGAAPQYGMFPSWQPPQDVRSIIKEELRAAEERKPKEAEAYVDIEEPVRLPDGRVVIGEDERPIMRHIRVPASQAGQLVTPTEDVETRFLGKMRLYKEVFGKELSEDKIRAIIREESPPAAPASSEKPVTLEEVKKVSSEAAQSAVTAVVEAHEKEDHEERRHKEVLTAIRESGSAKAVEGYREDSYRILGQGMQETAGAIRERRPLEVIIKDGGRILFGGPPEKEVEAGAGEGLLRRLKERGWVVEQ